MKLKHECSFKKIKIICNEYIWSTFYTNLDTQRGGFSCGGYEKARRILLNNIIDQVSFKKIKSFCNKLIWSAFYTNLDIQRGGFSCGGYEKARRILLNNIIDQVS